MNENEDAPLEPEEAGDPACWLHRLCPECGSVPDEPHPTRCWRCGAVLGDAAPDDEAPNDAAPNGEAGAADLG